MTDRGLTYDTVEAILAAGFEDITDVVERGQALASFRSEPAFGALMTAFNRANSLAKHAKVSDMVEERLEHPAEVELYRQLTLLIREVQPLVEKREYTIAFERIAGIKDPLNNFFENVMVMVEDQQVKANRLAHAQTIN
ncbi:hypothetical protein N752_16075 [Desulforamulus aquiferis]|nr:hypothetical protein N752_16075 [Desulforamulus aquiferis]